MRKLVTVLEHGPIAELNYINGPIAHPTRINVKNIALLVKNKKKVFEYDPAHPDDESKKIALTTIEQVTANNFGNTTKDEVEPKSAPVEDIPEVEEPAEEVVDETVGAPVEEVSDDTSKDDNAENQNKKNDYKKNKNKYNK